MKKGVDGGGNAVILDSVMENILTKTVQINGKPLGKAHRNLLAKLHKLGLNPTPEPASRVNPYSGVTCQLEPLAVTLHDFIINSYNAGLVGRFIPMNLWNESRYFFLTFWPEEYYSLID